MIVPATQTDLVAEARQLLRRMDQGLMSIAAYDTAWVGALSHAEAPETPAFPESLEWLCYNQHPDGSWGSTHEYYHDRVISTLASVLTLARWRACDTMLQQCERGLDYITRAVANLDHDPYATVGFELIVPTLLDEGERMGLRLPHARLARYREIRRRKLARIPPEMLYNRKNPALYSLEFMGDHLDRERAASVQEENGSIGNSPSATAYYLRACGDEPHARSYITQVMGSNGGGAVFSFPLEIFERAWVLYNLDLAGLWPWLREEIVPHLDYLAQVWQTEHGVGFSRCYSICDLDDTAITFRVLRRGGEMWGHNGASVCLDVFRAYAEPDHFRTFCFETDPSLSTNIHLLDALSVCKEADAGAMRETILAFMRRMRSPEMFWFDKWHASPYYVTSHAIIAAAPLCPELIAGAARWLMATQRPDGAWGYWGLPTLEETAYSLQALITYDRMVGGVPPDALHRAASYLRTHRDAHDHPPLWISKTLFAPLHIIDSAVISALAMYEQR